MYLPMHIKINAGSSATFATLPKLLKISFSLQAQTPTVKIPNPNSYNQQINQIQPKF